jgi:hypothetical protein
LGEPRAGIGRCFGAAAAQFVQQRMVALYYETSSATHLIHDCA